MGDPLHTAMVERLGCRAPIIQTAMGWVAGSDLVVATTNAGGFGFLAGATIAADRIEAEILRVKESVSGILAAHTGKSLDVVRRDTERDFFMSAEEAVAYGIVDQVIAKIGAAGEAAPTDKNAQPQ